MLSKSQIHDLSDKELLRLVQTTAQNYRTFLRWVKDNSVMVPEEPEDWSSPGQFIPAAVTLLIRMNIGVGDPLEEMVAVWQGIHSRGHFIGNENVMVGLERIIERYYETKEAETDGARTG